MCKNYIIVIICILKIFFGNIFIRLVRLRRRTFRYVTEQRYRFQLSRNLRMPGFCQEKSPTCKRADANAIRGDSLISSAAYL